MKKYTKEDLKEKSFTHNQIREVLYTYQKGINPEKWMENKWHYKQMEAFRLHGFKKDLGYLPNCTPIGLTNYDEIVFFDTSVTNDVIIYNIDSNSWIHLSFEGDDMSMLDFALNKGASTLKSYCFMISFANNYADSLKVMKDELNLMSAAQHLFEDPKKVKEYKASHNIDMEKVTDSYHTFEDLYMHRRVLSSIIFNLFPQYAWKSRKHSDGEAWDGLFITGVSIPGVGDYSYHYGEEFWNEFDVPVLEFAPEYDGHTPEDIGRLKRLIDLKQEGERL